MGNSIFRSGDTNLSSLDLVLEEGEFILRKNGNHIGRKYSQRGAYDLTVSICHAISTREYKGTFTINPEALKKIRDYEQSHNKPSINV